ncbi:hypothetical protein BBD39_08225 [Arsenophonus endosymbiont of Bemisia tabaci Asia II 3]|nr:hypothetical protein BBD39_08225 [Arsenophonus endosymbiont of Bemisia tabaci Asia II 3]
MKKIALIISMLFFYTGSVLALKCKVLGSSGDPYRETQPVGTVLIPKNSKKGEKIWISNLFTREVECKSVESEPVYFYYFPKVSESDIPLGMKFGITYNGKDTDLNMSASENGRRIQTDINVQANKPEKGIIKVRLYIKKDDDIDSSSFSGQLNIYQLDGKGGLNSDPKGNYRFSLSQLNNITEVTCNSNYSWRKFKVDINNDLTLKEQDVSNIGTLNLTCHANNNLGLSGKRVTLDVYPDTTKSAEAFTTNLDGLNFIFNVGGEELKPNNSINKPKIIVVELASGGNANFNVDGLFKLNYQEPGQDWLYNPATSTVTPKNVKIKSDLRLVE